MSKNQWFRMYAEFLTDPKVRMMPEAYQLRFVLLMCARCNGDVTLHDDEIAFQMRITTDEWMVTKAEFIARKLIDEDNQILNWDKRQFVSDSSAERVRKHREKKKRQCNVTVTPPDTDTDTENTPLTPQGGGDSVSHETKPERDKPQRPAGKSSAPPAEPEAESGFEAFYAAYPRKSGYGAARTQFSNELFFQNADPAQMVAAAKTFARQCADDGTEERFIPKPAKWLADQCYLDPGLNQREAQEITTDGMTGWQQSIAAEIGAAATVAWFVKAEWAAPVLTVPSRFAADHIRTHFLPALRRALGEAIKIEHTQNRENAA